MTKYLNAGFVNTSEAYSQITFFGNNNIVIPYINVGLMPDNPITHKQSFVDYSYYVLTGIKSMEYESATGQLILNFDLSDEDVSCVIEHITIGDYNSVGAEVKIECKDMHYYTIDNSKTSIHPNDFIPYDTPNFKQTLNTREIDMFFSFPNLPKEIRADLGHNISSIIWK